MSFETRIQLCGRLVVRLAGQEIQDSLPGRQGRVLFVYLAVRRRCSASREELVGVLWPEQPPGAADAALSALLSKLRRCLGASALDAKNGLRLVLPADAWVDLEAAAEALHRAESATAQEDWTGAWAPSRVALNVAARGFLPGSDAPWIAEVRRWLDDVRVRALECIASGGLGLGGSELASAERSARSLVEAAPYRESGYRLLMHVLERRGNAAEALLVFDGLRCRLRDELGAVPSEQTQDLHRQLLAGSRSQPGV